MEKVKEQKRPEWLNLNVGDTNQVATNPFSGESYELNALEYAIYQYTIGANAIAQDMDSKYLKTLKKEDMNEKAQVFWEAVRNGIDWFRRNNAKAYMVLLD